MAGKNWQASGRVVITAQAVVCAIGTLVPFGAAWAAPDSLAPASYLGSATPEMVWEALIGGVVVCAFLGAVVLWINTAIRQVKRSHVHRIAFVKSALNHLGQGVVMIDARQRIVFCNDRYLEIYGLTRADVPADMTAPRLLELRRRRGTIDLGTDKFSATATRQEGLVTELPDGRAILIRYFVLPDGGSIATHEDC